MKRIAWKNPGDLFAPVHGFTAETGAF